MAQVAVSERNLRGNYSTRYAVASYCLIMSAASAKRDTELTIWKLSERFHGIK